ncbi:MAG: hypothetical protein RJB09_1709, partial [Pseudomonadota bacterium]
VFQDKLDDQLAMTQALTDGEIFTRNRRGQKESRAFALTS